MRLSKATEGFLLFCATELSPHTIKSHRHHLAQLTCFLQDKDVQGVTREDVTRFFVHIRTEHRTPKGSPYREATVSKVWCATRAFFGWAADEFELCERPDTHIKQPRSTPPPIRTLDKDELRTLLKACKWKTVVDNIRGVEYRARNLTHRRNVALIRFLLDTGTRASETCRVFVRDVELHTDTKGDSWTPSRVYIQPFGSGRKSRGRIVRLGRRATLAVWRYLADRDDNYPDDPLFLTDDGREMNRTSLGLVFRRLSQKTGIHCYPHLFRHTCGTQLAENGFGVKMLMEYMGHSDIAMSLRYIHHSEAQKQAAFRRASVGDNWRL